MAALTLALAGVVLDLVFVYLIGVIVAAWLTIDKSHCGLAADHARRCLGLLFGCDLGFRSALHFRFPLEQFFPLFLFNSFSTKQLEMM
jgi:hypothetical protein